MSTPFKSLVSHLLRTNFREILAKSRLHCHAFNLHSIMLLEAPGKTIRLFVAEPGHSLSRNDPRRYEGEMSIGFHPHHCDLTLVWLRGYIRNWIVSPGGGDIEAGQFAYRSALRGQKPGFERVGDARLSTIDIRALEDGASIFMKASALHTVAVPSSEWAAWLVLEGAEDPNYLPVCYSTSDLENESFDHLYQPMPEGKLRSLLRVATLL